MKKTIGTLIGTALLITACATTQKVQMTPLQIQSMQTKTFKVSKRKAFDATMQVLQDMGYTVQSANFDTGFISAQGMTKNGDDHLSGGLKALKVLSELQSGRRISNTEQVKATAFIAKLPQHKIKVRLSLVNVHKSSMNSGSATENDQQILNAKTYDNLFNRLRQALFVGNAVA